MRIPLKKSRGGSRKAVTIYTCMLRGQALHEQYSFLYFVTGKVQIDEKEDAQAFARHLCLLSIIDRIISLLESPVQKIHKRCTLFAGSLTMLLFLHSTRLEFTILNKAR